MMIGEPGHAAPPVTKLSAGVTADDSMMPMTNAMNKNLCKRIKEIAPRGVEQTMERNCTAPGGPMAHTYFVPRKGRAARFSALGEIRDLRGIQSRNDRWVGRVFIRFLHS